MKCVPLFPQAAPIETNPSNQSPIHSLGRDRSGGKRFYMRHCEFVCRSSVFSLSIKREQAADESRYKLLCIPQFISPSPSCRTKPLCTNSVVCKLAFSLLLGVCLPPS